MARTKRSSKLDSKKRLSLEPGKRHVDPICEGQYLIYQRPKSGAAGSWLARSYDKTTSQQVQVRIGTADDFNDADGINILTFAQAQEKAKETFKQKDAEKQAAEHGEIVAIGAPYTVGDAIRDYLDDAQRRGMKTHYQTSIAARAHIIPSLGSVEIAKLTRVKIEAWLQNVAESPRRLRRKAGEGTTTFAAAANTTEEKRARKDTANRILTILKAALNHALDRGKVGGSGDPWKKVKPYGGVASTRIRFINVDDQQRLVNACSPDFRRLVQAALFTGARFGELTKLKIEDYDAKAGTVFISESKSGKARHLYLTEEAVLWFNGLVIGGKSGDHLFTRDEVKRRARSVSMENTQAWAQCDQQRPMNAACESAGLDPVRFHELRHSYASGLVNRGVPLAYIAAQLGHTDTRMVEKHYGHLAPNAMADAIRALAPHLGIGEPSKIQPIKLG
jgi:integrase